jgi:hypothetical protein
MTFPLQDLAWEMYRRNPFRLLGLSSTARKRVVTQRHNELLNALKLDNTDVLRKATIGAFAGLPSEYSLREAAGALNDPFRRLLDELFWFRSDASAGSPALGGLADGSPEQVMTIIDAWLHEENGTDLAPKHNIAVFHHLMALEIERRITEEALRPNGNVDLPKALREECDYCWRHALVRWHWLFEQDGFWDWLRTRGDIMGRKQIDAAALDALRSKLPAAILAINAKLALSAASRGERVDLERHRTLMTTTGFSPAYAEQAIRSAVAPEQARVRERIERFAKQREGLGAQLAAETRRLLDDVIPMLQALGLLLRENNAALDDLHEMLAEQINFAAVKAINEGDSGFAREVLILVEVHARSSTLKQFIRRNLETARINLEAVHCFYCKRKPRVEGLHFTVTMYKITAVAPTMEGVAFSTIPIHVPRCSECHAAHNARRSKLADDTPILRPGEGLKYLQVVEHLGRGFKVGDRPSNDEIAAFIRAALSQTTGHAS